MFYAFWIEQISYVILLWRPDERCRVLSLPPAFASQFLSLCLYSQCLVTVPYGRGGSWSLFNYTNTIEKKTRPRWLEDKRFPLMTLMKILDKTAYRITGFDFFFLKTCVCRDCKKCKCIISNSYYVTQYHIIISGRALPGLGSIDGWDVHKSRMLGESQKAVSQFYGQTAE